MTAADDSAADDSVNAAAGVVTNADPPAPPAGSPWPLLATLGGAGVMAGLLIVFVFGWTQPTIQAYKARVLAQAVTEVLADPARYDTLYVHDGALLADPPQGVDATGLEQIYLGYDADGRPLGFAIVAAKAGFQDVIRLIYGYDASAGRLLGMLVLENKETPGLGDKIVKDSAFVAEFSDVETPITGLKAGRPDDPTAPGGIDMITGATISSRTIVKAINESLERLGPLLDAYETTQVAGR